MLINKLLRTEPIHAMNFAPCLPAVFVAGSFRQLERLVIPLASVDLLHPLL
jgi:hypothetical protein